MSTPLNTEQLRAQLDNILNTPFVPNRRFCVAEMLLHATLLVSVASIFTPAFNNGLASILVTCMGGCILLGLVVFGVYGFSRDKKLAQEDTLKNFIGLSQKCVAIDPSLEPIVARLAQEMENNHLNAWWTNINDCLNTFIDHNSVAVVPVNFEHQKQQFIDGLNHSDAPTKPHEPTFLKL